VVAIVDRRSHFAQSWLVDRAKLREYSGGHPNDARHVSYVLRGPDLDPDAITRLTGLTPGFGFRRGELKVWPKGPRKGEPINGRSYDHGAWFLESGRNDSDEFHEHLDALLGLMRANWATFVELGQRYAAEVWIAIYLREAQGPLVQLLPDVAASFAELNATLSFDLYALPEISPQ
jgi:hypothetical protein